MRGDVGAAHPSQLQVQRWFFTRSFSRLPNAPFAPAIAYREAGARSVSLQGTTTTEIAPELTGHGLPLSKL